MAIDRDKRFAALIATGVALPLVIILAIVFAGGGGDPGAQHPSTSAEALPAVSVAAPTDTAAATVSTCAQLISALPLQLAGAKLRLTKSDPASSSIVAWGDPAIVLRCGVGKPIELVPSLVPTSSQSLFEVNKVLVFADKQSDDTIFTVVDRSVFVDVTVPSSYAQPPLGPIADAVIKVLPTAVCVEDPTAPVAKQCTRRK